MSTTPASAAPRRPGRPSAFSAELFRDLCQVIVETGCSPSAAAEALGVSTSSLSRWRELAPEVDQQLGRAKQEFRRRQLDVILNASSDGGWRAAAWLLVHIFPEDYSPRALERARFQAMAAGEDILNPGATLTDAPIAAPLEPPTNAAEEPMTPAPATPAPASGESPASVPDSHNSQNSALPPPADFLTTAAQRPRRAILAGPLHAMAA